MRQPRAATRARKTGAIDGLNLFFGALLGANLGTLQGLRLVHYMMMIAVLAGMVMTLRMVSSGDARGRVLMLLAFYGLLLAGIVTTEMRPAALSPEDLHRLVATMGVWIVLGLVIELSPTSDDPPAPPAPEQP